MTMTIDQPAATIIAAVVMASGAVIVALINKKNSDKPIIEKGSAKPLPAYRRKIWPSFFAIVFSVLMIVVSVIGIAPYWNSQEPATLKTIVVVFTYGISIFMYMGVVAWNAGILYSIFENKKS